MQRKLLHACLLISTMTIGLSPTDASPHVDERVLSFKVKTLADFAQLYGAIRFFHPSDEAQQIEWTRFVVHGVSQLKSLKTGEEVKIALERLFSPVAPTAQWFSSPQPPPRSASNTSCSPDRMMSWQHLGLRLFDYDRYGYEIPYESRRLNSGDSKRSGELLFKDKVEPHEVEDVALRQGISARIPLTVCRGEQSKDSKAAVKRLNHDLNLLTKDELKTDSEDVRIANMIIAWTELRHFFPYFDDIKVNWDKQLEISLAEVLRDQDAAEYFDTLRQMLALLEDGHIFVPNSPVKLGYLPIRVGVFDDEVVVIGSASPLFKRGDVIERFAEETGVEHLRRQESYISASPQLRRLRALNNFSGGPYGQSVELKLRRGDQRITLSHTLDHTSGRNQMWNTVNDFDFPDIKELSPGVFYVNGASTDVKEYQAHIHEIAQAKGVIFDFRWDGKLGPHLGSIDANEHVVGHIAGPDKGYTIPPANYRPQAIRPHQRALTFERSTGPDYGVAPKIKGEVVIILDHALMSSYESAMAVVSHYKLATTVGERTGGCNGNLNKIFLADGTSIPYTGMKVTRLDGGQLYLKGIEPDVPVKPTRAGMIAGQDEVLAKALDVLNEKMKRARSEP